MPWKCFHFCKVVGFMNTSCCNMSCSELTLMCIHSMSFSNYMTHTYSCPWFGIRKTTNNYKDNQIPFNNTYMMINLRSEGEVVHKYHTENRQVHIQKCLGQTKYIYANAYIYVDYMLTMQQITTKDKLTCGRAEFSPTFSALLARHIYYQNKCMLSLLSSFSIRLQAC